MTARRALVEPNDPLSMRWQCELLGVNRLSLYYDLSSRMPSNSH